MSNIGKLQSYIIDYLLTNNGKIIMLSGTWGSGKTHFWHQAYENSIEYHLTQSEKAHIYISLYGKTSLKAIENEVFIKAYNRSVTKNDDKLDVIEKLSSTFSSSSVINLVEQVSGYKLKNILELLNKGNSFFKKKKSTNFIKELVICFDDFERKSKDVNLNDLFGFITNLSLEFGANIVIILNDDVFNEEDKKVFYNVKEKSVNKFLKFNPSKEELFDIIFPLYTIDDKYRDILLSSILEMNVLNARIYKNIFENFEELIDKEKGLKLTEYEIRFFVLSIINFNLTHKVFRFDTDETNWKISKYFSEQKDIPINLINSLNSQIQSNPKQLASQLELIDILKQNLSSEYKTIEKPGEEVKRKATEKLSYDLKIVDKYSNELWSFWKLEGILNFRENVSIEKQQIINDFIENGYL